MTDFITVSRKEIEALFRRAVKGNIFQSELKDLLDKAEASEPVAEVGDASYYDGEISSYRPNGNLVIEHGLDYYSEEITKLPIGTKLYPTPQPSRIAELEAEIAKLTAIIEDMKVVDNVFWKGK